MMLMTKQELKIWRKKRKITQSEAAQQFGITLSQYQRLESGYSVIKKYIYIIISLLK